MREKISARCPFMCCGPLRKRQPFHAAHFDAGTGSRTVGEDLLRHVHVIPPTASISFSNCEKSTITTWLIRSDFPSHASTVWTASFGPPSCIAALIFSSPWPGTSRCTSRGIER